MTDTLLGDDEATKSGLWPVRVIITDKLYDLYGNQNVNVESSIAIERNAKYVVITTANLINTQVGLKIALNDHFESIFYANLFTLVLNLWFGIALVTIIYSYVSYDKPIKKSGLIGGILSKILMLLLVLLNNFDQYKDL